MRSPSRKTRRRPNQHVILERPGADPRACSRVERTKQLVEEILEDPAAKSLDPTSTSLAVHIASGWLGERSGFEASWEAFDAVAFTMELPNLGYFEPRLLDRMLESLCFALEWLAARRRIDPSFAQRSIRELRSHWPLKSKLPSLPELIATLFPSLN